MKNMLTDNELAFFAGQLAMILHSGISVLEGITILRDDMRPEGYAPEAGAASSAGGNSAAGMSRTSSESGQDGGAEADSTAGYPSGYGQAPGADANSPAGNSSENDSATGIPFWLRQDSGVGETADGYALNSGVAAEKSPENDSATGIPFWLRQDSGAGETADGYAVNSGMDANSPAENSPESNSTMGIPFWLRQDSGADSSAGNASANSGVAGDSSEQSTARTDQRGSGADSGSSRKDATSPDFERKNSGTDSGYGWKNMAGSSSGRKDTADSGSGRKDAASSGSERKDGGTDSGSGRKNAKDPDRPAKGAGFLRFVRRKAEAAAPRGKQNSAPSFGYEVLDSIYSSLDRTGSLSEALDASGVFPAYFTKMAEIGERSGTLEDVMASLSDYYGRQDVLMRSIRDALVYPLVLLAMLFAVLIVLMTQVMPVFEKVFEQLGIAMTGISELVFRISSVMQYVSIALLLILAVAVVACLAALRIQKGRAMISTAVSLLPIGRTVSDLLACSRFSDALSVSLHSGLDMGQSFELAASLTTESRFAAKTKRAKELTDSGEELATALRLAGIITGINARMVSIGVRTGSAETALKQISISCQDEADSRIRTAVGMLEPIMTAVLSVLTGLILVSVMLPLLGVMANIG